MPKSYNRTGGWCTLVRVQEENYTIHQAKDFLEDSFEYLEEVEVSDDGIEWEKNLRYGCDIPKGESKYNYICFNKKGNYTFWKHIRKINPEREKAIETIKQLARDNNINLSEI